jgi:magnesium-transporting ATPase (P-type)
LAAGTKAGGDRERIEKELPKQHEIPFDSDRKRSTVIRQLPSGKLRALTNGAPGPLLQRCTALYTSTGTRPLTESDRERIPAQTSAMAKTSLRVLGSACRDPEVMRRPPRRRSESITDRSFLRTMGLTGLLTASVTFAVYFYVLKTETAERARAAAFAVLVFAELWRAFGARSEVKPVWRIALFTNVNLVIVVAISFGLQLLSQHSARLGSILKTSYMSFAEGLLLVAIGAIPLLILEIVKVVRQVARRTKTA